MVHVDECEGSPGHALPEEGSPVELFLQDHILDMVLGGLRSGIEEATSRSQRVMAVLDVTGSTASGGLIRARVDAGPPPVQNGGGDQFARDLWRVWTSYDSTQVVPVVVVDLEAPVTCLRIGQLPWVRPPDRHSVCRCCGARECAN